MSKRSPHCEVELLVGIFLGDVNPGPNVGAGDVILEPGPFNAPLAAAAYLNSWQFTRLNECADSAVLGIQFFGYLLQGEEPQRPGLLTRRVVCHAPSTSVRGASAYRHAGLACEHTAGIAT